MPVNNVYKNSFRVLDLQVEKIYHDRSEAEKAQKELKDSGQYHMVKITSFKTGARPNKYNNFKQAYNYAVRAYSK